MNEARLLQVEGQIQALAQAWLRLAAQVEMAGERSGPVSPDRLDKSLSAVKWPNAAAPVAAAAEQMLGDLVQQLACARSRRHQSADDQ